MGDSPAWCEDCSYHKPGREIASECGVEPVVGVHIVTNDMRKCSPTIVEEKFRLLGRGLKSRFPKVAFSEILCRAG